MVKMWCWYDVSEGKHLAFSSGSYKRIRLSAMGEKYGKENNKMEQNESDTNLNIVKRCSLFRLVFQPSFAFKYQNQILFHIRVGFSICTLIIPHICRFNSTWILNTRIIGFSAPNSGHCIIEHLFHVRLNRCN